MAEKAAKNVETALRLLREKPVNSTTLERWFLMDDARGMMEGLPQPLAQGKGLRYVLERVSLPIDENDLFLGRYIDAVPTEEEEERFRQIYRDTRPWENPIVSRNGGHITLDFATLVKIGIVGYLEKAQKRLEAARAEGADQNTLTFLEGMIECYDAIKLYIARYAEAAEKAGKTEEAAISRRLTEAAPATFREAMQLVVFLYTIYAVYGGNAAGCFTLGRVDEFMLPFYTADLEKGILTPEEAGYYIDDLYCKMNLHIGRGEHQMANLGGGGNTTSWERNPSFDSPNYILIGGYIGDSIRKDNPLTELLLSRLHPQFKNPVIIFRRTKQDSEEIRTMLYDKLRQNAPILIYNDETMIPAMLNSGVEREDAINYSVHACNWPDIDTKYAVVDSLGGPIPRMLMAVLEKQTDFAAIDGLYDALAAHFRHWVHTVFERYRDRFVRQKPHSSTELSLTDCFQTGTIEAARNMYDGGVKYPVIYTRLLNIGTAADMMAAIDQLVYRQKVCTLAELAEAAKANFVGYEPLLAKCRQAPKFGTDDPFVDGHAKRLMTTLLDVVDSEATNEDGVKDVISLNVTITDMNHIHEGANLAATPDGRLSGAPLSENLSPTPGYCESVTALLNSVSAIPFDRIHSGAFNLRLRQDAVAGEDGLLRFMALCDTYFENGGMQLQISIADTETLRKAQKDPDSYRDLTVRITGYSAIFVDMSANAQEEIIRRDELS